jgi:hypothetical protein
MILPAELFGVPLGLAQGAPSAPGGEPGPAAKRSTVGRETKINGGIDI